MSDFGQGGYHGDGKSGGSSESPDKEIRMGSVLVLRKPHACGGNLWQVYRTGMDIGIKCRQCGRCVMMPKSEVVRQLKRIADS